MARLWNLLHDGVIERIDGSVPGDISLLIRVLYLRERFEGEGEGEGEGQGEGEGRGQGQGQGEGEGEGEGFIVHLSECSLFELMLWDSTPMSDLRRIPPAGIEVLSAEDGDPVKVCCAEGMLRMRYRSASLRLDSGAAVSLDELEAAATRYWDRFEARRRGAPGAG